MDTARYIALSSDESLPLTAREIAEGWCFCWAFDGLLVNAWHGPEGEVCDADCPQKRGYRRAVRSLGWIEITLWYRFNYKAKFGLEYNHLEYGHSHLSKPTPISAIQKASWTKARWSKRLGFVKAGVVIGDVTI